MSLTIGRLGGEGGTKSTSGTSGTGGTGWRGEVMPERSRVRTCAIKDSLGTGQPREQAAA